MHILVVNLVGPSGITVEDGQRVFEALLAAYEQEDRLILDFAGVQRLSAPFLMWAVGQLYKVYPADALAQQLQIINLPPYSQPTLQNIVQKAHLYFTDAGYQQAVDSSIQQTYI